MNEMNLTQHSRSTDVNASDEKMRELRKNDVLLRQFMSYKNINQNNNGLCKSSSDHKSAGV